MDHGIMTSTVRIGIAASIMGVCTRTIRRWDAAGKIQCTRTIGGHRRISLAIIEGHPAREADSNHVNVPSKISDFIVFYFDLLFFALNIYFITHVYTVKSDYI
jgi:excisionase family DNA binding protein